MRILVNSPAYLPSVGGLETVTDLLCRGLVDLGDEVVLTTRTPGTSAPTEPFAVDRRPSPKKLLERTRWAQVVLHQNLNARGLWPLLLVRRPLVVSHHSWYRRTNGRTGLRDVVKRAIVRRSAGSIAVSPAIAREVGGDVRVIANGYRADLFHEEVDSTRDGDLLFVGRLVSDKGCDLLLRAMATAPLRDAGARLSIVGAGPERAPLEQLALELGLGSAVSFLGELSGESLAAAYRAHPILVVPSRYDEPFGLVALESIACGGVVVGTAGGGLAAAIGTCGLVVPNGDVPELAATVARVRADDALRVRLRSGAPAHLAAHSTRSMARAYREVLARACGSAA